MRPYPTLSNHDQGAPSGVSGFGIICLRESEQSHRKESSALDLLRMDRIGTSRRIDQYCPTPPSVDGCYGLKITFVDSSIQCDIVDTTVFIIARVGDQCAVHARDISADRWSAWESSWRDAFFMRSLALCERQFNRFRMRYSQAEFFAHSETQHKMGGVPSSGA